jgi:hypothetical protein
VRDRGLCGARTIKEAVGAAKAAKRQEDEEHAQELAAAKRQENEEFEQ